MESKSSTAVRDVFLHLLSIAALYLVSFAFGHLLFDIINIYVPDALSYGENAYESLRFSIATLIVVFPLYFFVTRFLVRARQHPDYQDVRIRKWIIYLTLTLAAIAIASDLVTLLYWLLGGDVTARFLLKVAAVLLIAAVVFTYYFWELNARIPAIRTFVTAVVCGVTLVVISSFFIIGSPVHRRALRFDDRRVQDLQTLQFGVLGYWQQKGALPAALNDLRDDISGFVPPNDPVTHAPYEYRPLQPLQFELCATFAADADESEGKPVPAAVYQEPPYTRTDGMGQWYHGRGRTCFTRTIDPDLYRPARKILY